MNNTDNFTIIDLCTHNGIADISYLQERMFDLLQANSYDMGYKVYKHFSNYVIKYGGNDKKFMALIAVICKYIAKLKNHSMQSISFDNLNENLPFSVTVYNFKNKYFKSII